MRYNINDMSGTSFYNNLRRGMTLAELLVTVSILIVVMIAVGMFQYNILSYNNSTQVRLTNIQDATNILKVMSRELRSLVPSENGSYGIASAASSSIEFYMDIDSDGDADQLHYYISGTTLYRGTTPPTGSPAVYNPSNENISILATGMRNSSSTPLFEYYSSSYDGTTPAMTYPLAISSIRLIKVSLTIDTDPNKTPVVKTFSSQVAPRNLKDNL